MCDFSCAHSDSDLAGTFRRDGYAVIENVLDVDCINELRQKALRNFDELLSFIQEKNLRLGIGIKNGYKEIVQRHEHRYEVPYKVETDLYEIVVSNTRLGTIATDILGPDWILVNKSVLMSLSGAKVSS
jgi:ectoine hydroxylase-related dioxygenase (phytanoyl-CoA dioxygenase family)